MFRVVISDNPNSGRHSLGRASVDLRQIAEQSENLVEKVSLLASTLHKVGGGELLERQRAIEERAAAIEERAAAIEARATENGLTLIGLQDRHIPDLVASVGRLRVWMLAGLVILTLLSAGSLIAGLPLG